MTKKRNKIPKLIKDVPYEIEWVDTFGYTGWFTGEEIDEKITNPATNLTIGYFVKKKNGFIVLVMGKEVARDDFMPYNTPKFIPIGCIKYIKRINI